LKGRKATYYLPFDFFDFLLKINPWSDSIFVVTFSVVSQTPEPEAIPNQDLRLHKDVLNAV
jgi:hypothetical protein